MNYLSLFSGIEAASVAWHDFGWTCVGVSEIDPFPCAVLKERFPNVPNLGDITQISKEKLDELKEEHGTIDIVVGGSPCQSFSVAGQRKGLEDPRGNLMFEYCRVVRTVRPKYFIWENVPGALSSGKGADFGALIGEMVDIGYSLCWRVLDAQYFGVPQRRRRVFLVGCLGKNTSSFEVLFEQEGSPRDLKSSREKGQNDSLQAETSIGEHVEREEDNGLVYHSNHRGTPPKEHDKCPTLLAWMGTGGNNVPMTLEKSVTFLESSQPHATMGDVSVCSTLTASMGMGGGHVPMIVDADCFTQNTREEVRLIGGDGKIAGCLSASSGSHQTNYLAEYYEHNQTDARIKGPKDVAHTITARYGTGGGHVPFVLEQTLHESRKQRCGYDEKKVCPTLESAMGVGGGNIPLVMETTHENAVYLSSKLRTGGNLEQNVCPTLTAQTKSGDTMPLAIEHQSYNITFNDANGTRKDRPNGGCYINEVTTSNAITCGGVGDTRIVECIPIDMCTAPRVSANGKGFGEDGYPMYTLTTSNVHAVHTVQHTPCDLYNTSVYGTREVTAPVSKGNGECWENDKTFTSLTSGGGQMGQGYPAVRIESKVRRLTPLECERLQGFPDGWTEIAYKKKEAKDCPTSPRYKALGNSMAVPVMRFIGLGILEVENKK